LQKRPIILRSLLIAHQPIHIHGTLMVVTDTDINIDTHGRLMAQSGYN